MTDEEKPHFPDDDMRVNFGVRAVSNPATAKKLADFRAKEDARHEHQMKERAEQARRDMLARFIDVDSRQFVSWACPFCSAIVADREKHLDWHGSLEATAASARWAETMTRPIG
jgi:hypothetical protein